MSSCKATNAKEIGAVVKYEGENLRKALRSAVDEKLAGTVIESLRSAIGLGR